MLTKETKMARKVSSMNNKKSVAILFVPLIFAMLLGGCDKKDDNDASAQAQQQTPPEVGYVTVTAGNVGLVTELPGRLEAFRVADVRARVAGVVQKKTFEEGAYVKEGELLFQIDDAPYRAALQSAKAQLSQAQANLLQTKSMAERYKPLVKANAVSKQDYDNALAAQKASEANVQAAQAAITTAQINLGYAAVKSPISGRVGRSMVTEGALVGQGSATELAVVQQIDKLYVNITQTATDYIQLQEALKNGQYKRSSDGSLPITVILGDGVAYSKEAEMMFTDWTVNESTGQVTVRAVLDNDDQILLPGLYVRVRLEQMQAENAFLVPQQSIRRTTQMDTLFVVTKQTTEHGEMDMMEMRTVTIGGRKGNDWVVTSGLKSGDRVVVDGVLAQMAMGGALQAYGAERGRYEAAKAKGEAVGDPPVSPKMPVIARESINALIVMPQQNVPNAPSTNMPSVTDDAVVPQASSDAPQQTNHSQK